MGQRLQLQEDLIMSVSNQNIMGVRIPRLYGNGKTCIMTVSEAK
jgi:hypothetical protein